MSGRMSQRDFFTETKQEILKQKYEYMIMYLKETEKRVEDIRQSNEELKKTLSQLEQKFQGGNSILLQGQANNEVKRYQEEEKQKIKEINELKKCIAQYKYLCEEAIQNNQHLPKNQNKNSRLGNLSRRATQSARQNQHFNPNSDPTQNQNINNLSMIKRNKSSQKIKTKIRCQRCQCQYKPNEYYRHLQDCVQTNRSLVMERSVPLGRSQQVKGNEYKNMRN